MAVYPDKKGGKPTGRWCVEVQSKGRRLRDRCDTYAEGKAREDEFARAFASRVLPPASAKRKFNADKSRAELFSEAIKKADGRLWAGKASELDNFVKLRSILKIMGDKPLNDIGTRHVDDLIEKLTTKGLADGTVNRYLSAFHVFLEWCLKRDYRTSPLPSFAWRDEDEGRIRWITEDEEMELKVLLSEEMWKVVRLAIRTGMRRTELLTVEPAQISLGWCHLWATKSGNPRSVPLSIEDEEDLRWLVQGRMPTPSALRYAWDQARETMGLTDDPWFVFHACRHTCATRMVNANVNLRVIQTWMGHKRIETTLRYAHVNDTLLTGALETVLAHRVAA